MPGTQRSMRISGCLSYLMESAMKEEGHLYLERPELIQRAYTMLNQDLPHQAVTEMDIQRVLYRLVMQESIVVDGERVYVRKQYEEENQTASMIARRLLDQGEAYDIEKELAQAQTALAITLSERQKQAVRMVFQNQISIITGGQAWNREDHRLKSHPLYPCQGLQDTGAAHGSYGRAARRMAESTGHEDASTMHMALGLLGDFTDYEDAVEYLEAGFLNLDEVSMVDMHLGYEFSAG